MMNRIVFIQLVFVTFAIAVVGSESAFSESISSSAKESFGYTAAQFSAENANGGNGWEGPWRGRFVKGDVIDKDPVLYTLPQLDLQGPKGYRRGQSGSLLLPKGKKIWRLRRMANPLSLNRDGIYFVSFLVKRGKADDTKEPRFGVTFRSQDAYFQDWMGASWTSAKKGFLVGAGQSVKFTAPLEFGRNVLCVARIKARSNGPDRLDLTIMQQDETLPSDSPAEWSAGNIQFDSNSLFDLLIVHGMGDAAIVLDELRVGSTWQSVTSDPISADEGTNLNLPRVPTFQHHVRKVLAAKCFSCHGPDVREGGLDLRTLETTVLGGDSGSAIQPGKPGSSLLLERIVDGDMPPEESKPLKPGEVALIQQWIKHGKFPTQEELANVDMITEEDRQFWSFKKPIKHVPPSRDATGSVWKENRVRNEVDAFIFHRHLKTNLLSFSPDTDRRTLIRRAYFDLIGLPPEPEEVAAFVASQDPQAYEHLIDRLLDSKHYGERWGRHWLDVAGWSESNHFFNDRPRDYAWPYRDYVIRSFNQDKPYDQFLTEQLAGDELVDWRTLEFLSPEQTEKLIATGFLRTFPDFTDVQNIKQEDKRWAVIQGQFEIAIKVTIGMNLNCVRCHTHKFDPIPQRDYYRMLAWFRPALDPENWIPGNIGLDGAQSVRVGRWLPNFESKEQKQQHESLLKQIAKLKKQKSKVKGDQSKEKEIDEQLEKLKVDLKETTVNAIRALWDVTTKPSATHVLSRGDFSSPLAEVQPGFLSVLDRKLDTTLDKTASKVPKGTTGRRLTLARWMTQPDHPLTSRVIVNRVWQYHFGHGLVATPDDFGSLGSRPTHPELLDWLAVDFVENSWSIKRLHRQIMLSTTYRQSSEFDEKKASVDESNHLYWRFPRRRLEAEVIRDSMLMVSGDLDRTMYGQPLRARRVGDGQYVASGKRRTIYTFNQRSAIPDFLTVFDAPQMETNMPHRARSAVASQSLALMNNPFVLECSQSLANRILKDSDKNRTSRLFQLAYSREPSTEERKAIETFLASRLSQENPDKTMSEAWTDISHALFSTSEFIYVE